MQLFLGSKRVPALQVEHSAPSPWAMRLLVLGTIPGLFFDVTLVSSSPAFSLQKVLGIATIPLGLYLARNAPSGRVVRAVVSVWMPLSIGVAVASLAGASLGRLITVQVALAAGAVSALAVGIVVADARGRVMLARVAVAFAFISSVLVFLSGRVGVGQREGGIGELADPDRGIGLRADPNFLALSLAMALPLTGQLSNPILRTLTRVIVLLGLASTASRMGLLLGVPSLVLWTQESSLRERLRGRPIRRRRGNRFLSSFVLITALGTLAISGAFAGTVDRFADAGLFVDGVACGLDCAPYAQRASFDRGLLLRTSFEVVASAFPMPAGLDVIPLIEARSGLPNVPHNSLMDALFVAGLFGFVGWARWVQLVLRRPASLVAVELRVLVLTVFVATVFLSILEASEFWIALGVAVSIHQVQIPGEKGPSPALLSD